MIAVLMLLAACTKTPATVTPDHGATQVAAPAPAAVTGPRVVLPDGTVLSVEIAADDQTRAQGLMFRDYLPPRTGMLFLFPRDGEYSFWMKNCRMPLDMIFIESTGRVAHIKDSVPPCPADPCPNYPSNVISRYVLELAGGEAGKLGMKVGDVVRIEGTENVVIR
jgi:uncharacterized protein